MTSQSTTYPSNSKSIKKTCNSDTDKEIRVPLDSIAYSIAQPWFLWHKTVKSTIMRMQWEKKQKCYYIEQLWWSRGSVLAFGTQVHGFKPGWSRRIFQGKKILSTPSFRKEVKPSAPCHRFAACKRSLQWRGSCYFRLNYRPFLSQ